MSVKRVDQEDEPDFMERLVRGLSGQSSKPQKLSRSLPVKNLEDHPLCDNVWCKNRSVPVLIYTIYPITPDCYQLLCPYCFSMSAQGVVGSDLSAQQIEETLNKVKTYFGQNKETLE